MIQLGLAGWPVSHSLSPRLHNAALKAVGLDGNYQLFPIDPSQPEKMAELLDKVRNFSLIMMLLFALLFLTFKEFTLQKNAISLVPILAIKLMGVLLCTVLLKIEIFKTKMFASERAFD